MNDSSSAGAASPHPGDATSIMGRPAAGARRDPLSASERHRLALLLDALLPGDGPYPPASELDLAADVQALAGRRASDDDALRALLAALPAVQLPAMRRAEADHRHGFRSLLELAYCAYYAHPRVRRVLAERFGYPDRPPQPDGYHLDDGA